MHFDSFATSVQDNLLLKRLRKMMAVALRDNSSTSSVMMAAAAT
jgi:hypothetical protein